MIPLSVIAMYYTNKNTQLHVELAYYELDKRLLLTFYIPTNRKHVIITYNLKTDQYNVLHVDEDKLDAQLKKLENELKNDNDTIIIVAKKENKFPYFKSFYLVTKDDNIKR